MFDYHTHVNALSEEKLHEEIRKIYDRLFVTSQSSPVYDQLLSMLEQAQEALGDIQASRRVDKSTDGVINIGEIDSVVNELDYKHDELLNVIVTSYIKQPRKPPQ